MPKLRLTEILRAHRESLGSVSKLVAAIRTANDERRTVDARKLADILNDEVVSLKMSDLETLDRYLRPYGQSLSDEPLFVEETGSRLLAEHGDVVFALPTKATVESRHDHTSVWDLRGFSHILQDLSKRWPQTRVTLKEEREHLDATKPGERDWSELFDQSEASYCCLGGPVVFGLAEFMLAEMFGVPPFRSLPTIHRDLPFHFVWYPDPRSDSKTVRFPSHFALSPDDLADSGLALPVDNLPEMIEANKAQALLVGKEVKAVPTNQEDSEGSEEYKSYGVVVAQRREQGVWVVVAGLSGPATYAAAKEFTRMSFRVPDRGAEETSKPVYAVVESTMRVNRRKKSGDRREVVSQETIVGPKVWHG